MESCYSGLIFLETFLTNCRRRCFGLAVKTGHCTIPIHVDITSVRLNFMYSGPWPSKELRNEMEDASG